MTDSRRCGVFLGFGLLGLATAWGSGQENPSAGPTPRPTPTPPALVVRIGVSLVQVDAVVTDADGRHVTDLKAEDFELEQDGRPQPLSHCEYVRNAGPAPAGAAAAPAPSAGLRPEQVKRAMAIVVDDLGLSFDSLHRVRRAVAKFVDEQMQPGDLAAIVRTGAGIGVLQQFTSDRRILKAAAGELRYNTFTRETPRIAEARTARAVESGAGAAAASAAAVEPEASRIRRQAATTGTLGALTFVLQGLQGLPGRKSVVMFSDQLSTLGEMDNPDPLVVTAAQRVTDLANRASVVIYTVHARGLPVSSVTASQGGGLSGTADASRLAALTREHANAQTGLGLLAERTGGFLVANQDVDRAFERVASDQAGYYLLGYAPEPSTFDRQTGRPAFRTLKVKVKRPGLRVRSRAGFLGVADAERPAAVATPGRKLLAAVVSPFAAVEIPVRLTSLFGSDPGHGALVRSFLHVDAARLSFDAPLDGRRQLAVELSALVFGDDGALVSQLDRAVTMKVRAEEVERFQRKGLIVELDVPVPKPGAYQVRAAVMDRASQKLGSASQFVRVPDLKQKRLILSGLLLSGEAWKGAAAEAEADPGASPAVRRFAAGSSVVYLLAAYNARTEGKLPRLEVRLRILRDGDEVFRVSTPPLPTFLLPGAPGRPRGGGRPSAPGFGVAGGFQLPPTLEAGDYVLEVAVTDLLSRQKPETGIEYATFEIVAGAPAVVDGSGAAR